MQVARKPLGAALWFSPQPLPLLRSSLAFTATDREGLRYASEASPPLGLPTRPDSPSAPCPAPSFLNDPARLPHASLPLNSSPLCSQRLALRWRTPAHPAEHSWRVPSPSSLSGSMQTRLVSLASHPGALRAPQETSSWAVAASLGPTGPGDRGV